jgi:hypothetical protein
LKKQVFNDKHDIKIFGYDVELYAQDNEEPHFATGVYSVMNDEWVTKPKQLENEIDKSVLEKKIKNWTEKIDKVIESENSEDDIKLINSYLILVFRVLLLLNDERTNQADYSYLPQVGIALFLTWMIYLPARLWSYPKFVDEEL